MAPAARRVLTDDGPLALAIPRDRDGTFEPQLIGQHERRFAGGDDKILALYARALTVREIQASLREMYAVEVSPDFISTVIDAAHAEPAARQTRPIDPLYPVVFFDALRVKSRDEATVSKAVYLALALFPDGRRDILIAVTDGLKGLREALEAVFPRLRCRRASCTCCGTASISPIGRSASSWRRRSGLASRHPVLRLPAGDPPGARHDECAGARPCELAQDPRDPGPLSRPTRRPRS